MLAGQPVAAGTADCHAAQRAMYRRARQSGDAGAVCAVPGSGRILRGQRGGNCAVHPVVRAVSDQGAGHLRDVLRDSRPIQQRGTAHAGRPDVAARRGAQDCQPDYGRRIWRARRGGGHALHPHQQPAGAVRQQRPAQSGTPAARAAAAGRIERVLPPDGAARARGVRRAQTGVQPGLQGAVLPAGRRHPRTKTEKNNRRRGLQMVQCPAALRSHSHSDLGGTGSFSCRTLSRYSDTGTP